MQHGLRDAIKVLNATKHRGLSSWGYVASEGRVMPAEWASQNLPPSFTAFETLMIARGLVRIGARRDAFGSVV